MAAPYARVKGVKKLIADTLAKKYAKAQGGKYMDRPEARYLNEQVTWLGASKMIYLAVLSTIHEMYGNGLMDLGYIRLCCFYLQKRRITTVDERIALEMEKSVLPYANYQEVLSKVSALMPELKQDPDYPKEVA